MVLKANITGVWEKMLWNAHQNAVQLPLRFTMKKKVYACVFCTGSLSAWGIKNGAFEMNKAAAYCLSLFLLFFESKTCVKWRGKAIWCARRSRTRLFLCFWGLENYGTLIACAEKRAFCLNFVAFYPNVRSPTASLIFQNFMFFWSICWILLRNGKIW